MKSYTGMFLLIVTSFFEFEAGDTLDSQANLKNVKKRVIIDTDAGVDDAVAILNLLGAQEVLRNVEVEFVTTVNGNTNVDYVGRNVLKILKTASRLDIPVYRGANYSLLLTPPAENFFGEDGFRDFDFPDPPSEKLIKKKVAANALVAAARSYYRELTLVCLGPLTNVALAIKLDPSFLTYLKEIYILGGSDSGLGNVKPGVEFNFYMDPEAAFIVFKEAEKRNKTLVLIPWETIVQRSPIDMDWRKNILGAVNSSQVHLLNKAENLSSSEAKWVSSDAVVASLVVDDSIIKTCKNYHVDVEVCGMHSKGAIFIDYESGTKLSRNVRIVSEIDTAKFKNLLLMTLNPRGEHNNGSAESP